MNVELLIIGNEILIGKIKDTKSDVLLFQLRWIASLNIISISWINMSVSLNLSLERFGKLMK